MLLINLVQSLYKDGAHAEAQEKFEAVVGLDKEKYYLSIIPEKIAQAKREQEIARFIKEAERLEESQSEITPEGEETETFSFESAEPQKGIRKLEIKVLSGDGDLNSAKEMANKLTMLGHRVRLIHHAPRPIFLRNTVFFAPEFENEGKRLVSKLGNNTRLKPLTWHSIFNLIVVTGRNADGS